MNSFDELRSATRMSALSAWVRVHVRVPRVLNTVGGGFESVDPALTLTCTISVKISTS